MTVAHNNPFDEAYVRANFSNPRFHSHHGNSGGDSADASVAANESSTSLVDPLLDKHGESQQLDSNLLPRLPHTHTRLDEDTGHATRNSRMSQSEMRLAGQKPTKNVAPIHIPRRSDGPSGGLSSAALTSSFPMPPPRTPATPSQAGTFGSPSTSRDGHSHQGSSGARTGTNSPREPQHTEQPPSLPRKLLSVPPPTPAFSNSRASSSLGLYWEGESSFIRNSGSHPAPTAVLPYYSPDPAAQVYTPMQEEPYSRINSFAAELSSILPSMPASPSYPPRTYSPAGSSDMSRNGTQLPASSLSSHDRELMRSPGNQASRPLLHRSHSEILRDHNVVRGRRESAGTFGTVFSSVPSIGMNQAINTLENEDFASTGTRTTTHTRTHSEVSMASSAGMTHELVRRGNVFEAHPSTTSGAQEASRRLARASLVSSELLRSASSTDALRSALADDPAYAVDQGYDNTPAGRPATRVRHSHRYSSGPAPTLASLAEDEDDGDLPPADLDYMQAKRKSRHRSGSRRPSDQMPRRNSDWGNKSSKSYSSHRSGKSSAHFTVASHAPSLPSLHNSGRRAEIAVKEATIPFKKLAKRASTLGDILDNMPEHERYVSYPAAEDGSRNPSYDEINELRYSNQLRKARRKIEVGVPGLWSSHTPMGSVSTGIQGRGLVRGEMREKYTSNGSYHVHPEAEVDERHFRRRKSYPASQLQDVMSTQSEKASSSGMYGRSSFSSSGTQQEEEQYRAPPPQKLSYWQMLPPQKKKKVRLAVIFFVGLLIAAIIGAAIPLSKRSGKSHNECDRTCAGQSKAVLRDGACTCQCNDNRAGPFCDLDTTCVCPDGSDECPNRLSKSILSTAAYASTLFAPPINTTRLAASLATAAGGNSGDCSSQTHIIETPNLDPVQYKARRRWAQAVYLWDAATSEDFASRDLHKFQAGLSYWQWQDSPSFQAQPSFQIQTHGYSIDFAFQRVFVVPQTLNDLGVSQSNIARLSNNSASALERVGAFAMAASTQRSNALATLFQHFGYTVEQLASFRSSILASPVVFPFDATTTLGSHSSMAIAFQQKSSGAGFPIPAACLPALSAPQLVELNRVESDIFGLPAAVSTSDVSTNCTDRPTYGILNVLNLQLPFLDPQRPQQAAVVTSQDRKSRLTFLTGQSLIPLSYAGAVNASSVTTASFGTVHAIDNVLFDYLAQLRDTNFAKAVIDYILSGTKVPPTPSSDLGSLSNGLQAIPIIEAQMWGSLSFADVDYIVSGVSQPGGNALFGSEIGAELRNWAHSGEGSKPIRWSLEPTSSQYALDSGSSGGFQGAWDSSRTSSPAAIFANLGTSNLLTA